MKSEEGDRSTNRDKYLDADTERDKGRMDDMHKYFYMSEEDGTAVCSHMIFGVRWSPEFSVKAPQNAGLERESYPSLGHNSWPEAAYSNAPQLATSRQPPQHCAGITLASDTCRDQREHVPTETEMQHY